MLIEIENNQFRVLYPDFLRVFKDKIHFMAATMMYMNDTLDEEDVLVIVDGLDVKKLTFANLALVKTTLPQNFVVDERPTTSFPPAFHVTDNYACVL